MSLLFFIFLIILGIFLFSIAAGLPILFKVFYRKKRRAHSPNTNKDDVPGIPGVPAALSNHIHDETIMIPLLMAKKRRLNKQESNAFFSIEIAGTRGTSLRGDVYKQFNTNKFVLIVHGFSDSAAGVAYLAEEYIKFGINVVAINMRAHGLSDGKLAGVARRDSKDLVFWVQEIVRRFGDDTQIYLHGISMGAGTVLQYPRNKSKISLRLVKNIQGIIADCGFCCFSRQFDMQLSYIIGKTFFQRILKKILLFGTSFCNFIFNGFFFFQSSPVSALKTKQGKALIKNIPMIIFHGEKDLLVTIDMSTNIYNAIRNFPDKQLIVIPNAPHIGSFFYDPEKYMSSIKEKVFKMEKDR